MNAPQRCTGCNRPKAINPKKLLCRGCALIAAWEGIGRPRFDHCRACGHEKSRTINECCHPCANAATRAGERPRKLERFTHCIDCGKPRGESSPSPRCAEHSLQEIRRRRRAATARAIETAPQIASSEPRREDFPQLLARAQALRQQKECRP